MTELDQQVARRLTRFYILALTVIALLTVSGLLFIKQTIRDLNDNGRVLNVAGRQRMLSQRLTKITVLKLAGIPSPDTPLFDSLLTAWSTTHVQLRKGRLLMEKAYDVPKSIELNMMFDRIESSYQTIYTNFVRIGRPGLSDSQQKQAVKQILAQEPIYLSQMNTIVFQFDAENFARVKHLERIEWILSLATLLTLLIEGLLIFRPVVNYTRRAIRQLAASEKALQLANERLAVTNLDLEAANRTLVDTQALLVRTVDEKYALQRAEDRVRSAALLEGQEEERRRFARELHDGIGQMLTGLNLHAGKLKKIPFKDDKQRLRFEELCTMIQDIIQTTRQISHNLMPSVLGDFGLEATLQLLAQQTAQASAIDVQFTGTGDEKRHSPAVEIGLYRIAQEALNNAVKYAGAHQIDLRLLRTRTQLIMTVEDDGKGFSPRKTVRRGQVPSVTNGLENMRTRARLLNGDLTISSTLKKGTRVVVKLPLSDTQIH